MKKWLEGKQAEMNNIKTFGMMNYQTTFSGNSKAIRTLADKINQKKVINKKVTSLSEKYFCPAALIKKAFKIDNKTTINQLNTRALNFAKNIEEYKQGLRRELEIDNITVDEINIYLKA